MTAKFKQIIEQLNALITFEVDGSMTDEDFIADIEAVNLLCNLYDDLGLDRSGIRGRMNKLYPELTRRIYSKENIQHAMPLIKALDSLIYGRTDDRGPAIWRENYNEMCCGVVDAYRKEPLIDTAYYLFALDTVCRISDRSDNPDMEEYKEIVAGSLGDIDNVCLAEKIKRVRVYKRAKHLFISPDKDRWTEICMLLNDADVSRLDDRSFILWREITDLAPMKELKNRAGHSKQMQVEYLQGLIFTEFERERRASIRTKLARDLKTLDDDLIGDIIPVKIDAEMSVSTLHALETIFYLRLQLAQVGWDETEPIYNSLCRNRFGQLAKALKMKYKTAGSLNAKIEILERLVSIGTTIHSSDFSFAIEEAKKLKALTNLTYAQKLRLDWLRDIGPENESQVVAAILPRSASSFEIATLALIFDCISDQEREAVLSRYFALFDEAISESNIAELGKLLSLAACWNIDPTIRHRLNQAADNIQSINALSLPERRVNPIAAEIYHQIDSLAGKYNDIPA